eukprot:TRINITY_DN3824_c0_g2_i1.p1 TRINITY_DN3824_c0_g2~~TRINITY_DN3824_c0_g2_i1.p1  ORF type:complete len:136 (-),score=9.16 TRINITY_DN3824_c0_g2_i1:249-656(-)
MNKTSLAVNVSESNWKLNVALLHTSVGPVKTSYLRDIFLLGFANIEPKPRIVDVAPPAEFSFSSPTVKVITEFFMFGIDYHSTLHPPHITCHDEACPTQATCCTWGCCAMQKAECCADNCCLDGLVCCSGGCCIP